MAARVTIQDIADELGLSRNTVSKAINNTGVIAESTRRLVLQKAAEMGYKQFSYFNSDALAEHLNTFPELSGGLKGEIAFLTTMKLDNAHFGSVMMDKICHEFDVLHFTVSIHFVMPQDLALCRLPAGVDVSKIRGMICAELLDEAYCRMLASLDLPLLFVDAPLFLNGDEPDVDILLMDNEKSIRSFILGLKEQGISRIGFVGPYLHCRSFNERYLCYRRCLEFYGLPFRRELCILDDLEHVSRSNQDRYIAQLRSLVRSMPELPEVFICANDFIAIDLMTSCRDFIRFPEDVMVLGFDDSAEARIVSPTLSSVHIHSQTMGQYAVGMLYQRIRQPDFYHVTVHVATDLVLRDSTRRPG